MEVQFYTELLAEERWSPNEEPVKFANKIVARLELEKLHNLLN